MKRITQKQLARLVTEIVRHDRSLSRYQAAEIAASIMKREGYFARAMECAKAPMILNGIPRW